MFTIPADSSVPNTIHAFPAPYVCFIFTYPFNYMSAHKRFLEAAIYVNGPSSISTEEKKREMQSFQLIFHA